VDQSDCVCVDDAVLQVFHGKVLKWSQEKQVRKRKGRATENVNAVLDELRRLLFDQTATVTVVCRRKLPSLSLVAKDHDVVLTTYETLENTDMIENRVFWWRVVLDESQMAKSPKHAITKRGSVLPRVHSWLVSGTPMPTLVDDLLGQLTFLGVEPFCRTGADVDDWWKREVSERFRDRDEDALSIVTNLLQRIMMRHTKALACKEAVLPPQTCTEVFTTDTDTSSRVVYLAVEAFCQAEAQIMMSQRDAVGLERRLLDLKYLLRCSATHASILRLDELEELLRARSDESRRGVLGWGGGIAARHGLYGEAHILRHFISDQSPRKPGLSKLQALVKDVSKGQCMICNVDAAGIIKPVVVHCCLSLYCLDCATVKLQRNSRGKQVTCPVCKAGLGVQDYTLLQVPLDKRTDGGSGSSADPPSLEAATHALMQPPSQQSLSSLRVWECDGAGPGDTSLDHTEWLCRDGMASRKPCHVQVDGQHFCTRTCMQQHFQDSLHRSNPATKWQVCRPHDARVGQHKGWAGSSLAGEFFESKDDAVEALWEKAEKIKPSDWEGKKMYRGQLRTRDDPRYPHTTKFLVGDTGVPRGSFLAHYDAAGGRRPYGVHPGTRNGPKFERVLTELDEMDRRRGSKAVIFSSNSDTLSVLYTAIKDKYGEAAIASIGGLSSPADIDDELHKFRSTAKCFALLLAVQSCAAGLNLTHADHCFLVEPQEDLGTELQLISRIHRIGQTRPVVTKKFIMADTIEQRMLERRKVTGGLYHEARSSADAGAGDLAAEDEEEEAADGGRTSKSVDFRFLRDIRFCFGLE